jgi:hypothetical protein
MKIQFHTEQAFGQPVLQTQIINVNGVMAQMRISTVDVPFRGETNKCELVSFGKRSGNHIIIRKEEERYMSTLPKAKRACEEMLKQFAKRIAAEQMGEIFWCRCGWEGHEVDLAQIGGLRWCPICYTLMEE